MALPKIAPRTTRPMSTVSTSVPCLSSSMYRVYPNHLPAATDLPTRINPTLPEPPQRRTTMLETIDAHWNNAQRTDRMKQRDHYRYHNAWSKYYYGNKAEQESHRAYTRTVLKQQMTDKWATQRYTFSQRVKESEAAVTYDNSCRQDDSHNSFEKGRFLQTYRDENKIRMETAWADRRMRKMDVDKYDREQLKFNPINWSATLT